MTNTLRPAQRYRPTPPPPVQTGDVEATSASPGDAEAANPPVLRNSVLLRLIQSARNPKILGRLVVVAIALGLVGYFTRLALQGGEREGVVETPAAEVIQERSVYDVYQERLAQARLVIQQRQIPVSQEGLYQILGHEVFVSAQQAATGGITINVDSHPQIAWEAAQVIIDEQMQALVQTKAAEFYTGMQLGLSDPDHVCYQLQLTGPGGCLGILSRGADSLVAQGAQESDIDKLLLGSFLKEALLKVQSGDTSYPGNLEIETLRLAQTVASQAQLKLDQLSSNGQSAAIIQSYESFTQPQGQ